MKSLNRVLLPVSLALFLYFFTFLSLHFLPSSSSASSSSSSLSSSPSLPLSLLSSDPSASSLSSNHVGLNLRQPREAFSDGDYEGEAEEEVQRPREEWISSAPEELREAEERFAGMIEGEELGEDEELYFRGIRTKARRIAQGREEIYVSFADGEYAPFALNWYHSLQRIGITNALVLVSDKQAYSILQSKGVKVLLVLGQTVSHLSSDPRTALLQARWRYTIELLKGGLNVIMSDIDVVWLSKPSFPMGFDLMASSVPESLADKESELLAGLGVSFFASNSRVIYLLRQVLQDIEETKNDQRSLNALLVRSFLSEDLSPGAQANSTDLGIPFRTLSPPIRILLFGDNMFSHECEADQEAFAVHCVSEGSSHLNALSLIKAGLWLLDDDLNLAAKWRSE